MPVTCEVTFADDLVYALGWREQEIGKRVKLQLASYCFQKRLLSFGQARRLAEIPVVEFLDLLKAQEIPLHYDMVDYEEDLRTIKELVD